MKTIKNINKSMTVSSLRSVAMLSLVATFIFTMIIVPIVQADQYDEKINALAQDSQAKQNQTAQLGAEAASISDTISKLQSQINAMQEKINVNEAKIAELKVEIQKAEAELVKQKKLLGAIIKSTYVDGDITTLEMLATSKDLSDFFDKQQYKESVRTKIKQTLDKVQQLKLDLNTQKETIEKINTEQKSLQNQLSAQRAESDRLLGLNQEQQGALNAQIKDNSSKIAQLRAAQAAENAKRINSSGGRLIVGGNNGRDTYPTKYRNIPQDAVVDAWGMYNRQCVSYTAWKVYESGRHMPYWGGIGNANQWDDNARRAGIPVDTSPRAGDVAVAHWGYYGHVMYVESVNPNGTINISQYNYDFKGTYSEIYGMSTAGLVFIHF